MISQAVDSSVPSTVLRYFYSKVGLADQYIIMATGRYKYEMLVRNPVTKKILQYTCTRYKNSEYDNEYECTVQGVNNFTYSVSNDFYVYSNIGEGIRDELPIYSATASVALSALLCVCFIGIMFGGVLFCKRK